MTIEKELEIKLKKIRAFMAENGYGGVLFGAQPNFSWLTCGGDNQIIHGAETGFVHIMVTEDELYIITNNIEMPRVLAEEVRVKRFKNLEYVWTEDGLKKMVGEISGDRRIASDYSFPGAVNEGSSLGLLRVPLTEAEVERFRKLAGMCSKAMDETLSEIKPGMSEFEIQGVIGEKLLSKGVYPVVLLVGTDERVFQFRHPMPTDRKLKRYCMIVICAQRWGLILNMTRLVHFGTPPDEIKSRYRSLHRVDMAYITATRPGNTMNDVFAAGKKAYADEGFPGEELRHFQGGTCGYLTREVGLSPGGRYVIQDGEIFAHNPTITGTKIEDSILVKGKDFEVLTLSDKWPSVEVEYDGVILKRPEILVR